MPGLKHYLPCLLFCFALNTAIAQPSVWQGSKEQLADMQDKGRKKISKLQTWKNHLQQWGLDSNYRQSLSVGARLHTNGWAGGIYYLNRKSAGRHTLWALHFGATLHEKETRLQRTENVYQLPEKGKPYVFGKINNAYSLRLSYGRQQLLLPGLIDGNLSVSLRYAAGPALTLLKPYYLKLLYVSYTPEETVTIAEERYRSENREKFLQSGSILGSGRWSKGLAEMKYLPGVFAELAFVLEPDKNKSFIQTITIGGQAAFYTGNIEILADRKAYPYQASFFVGLALGKRWK